jgi:hypothetical protein
VFFLGGGVHWDVEVTSVQGFFLINIFSDPPEVMGREGGGGVRNAWEEWVGT